jgi:hypothetical protein
MTRVATLTPALLLAATVALACGTDKPQSPSPTAAASETGASASETAASAEDGAPQIAADAVHEFGAIKPTDSIEHVFVIRNEGTADLKIERVQKT